MLVVGARKRIVACTAEAAEHLHRDAAKLLNAPLSSLPAPLARLIQETARSGKAILNREIPLGQCDGIAREHFARENARADGNCRRFEQPDFHAGF